MLSEYMMVSVGEPIEVKAFLQLAFSKILALHIVVILNKPFLTAIIFTLYFTKIFIWKRYHTIFIKGFEYSLMSQSSIFGPIYLGHGLGLGGFLFQNISENFLIGTQLSMTMDGRHKSYDNNLCGTTVGVVHHMAGTLCRNGRIALYLWNGGTAQ